MTRNLKALGLALVAAFAFSALAASAAQAEFTFTGYASDPSVHVHTTVTSTQSASKGDKFSITTGKSQLECEVSKGEATSTTGDDATITLNAEYAGCSASIGFVTVEMTSCDYKFHITEKITEHQYKGTVDVACSTPGDAIDITVFTNSSENTKLCHYTVEEQNGITGITYTNKTDKAHKYIEVDINAHNIKSKSDLNGNILCQTPLNTTHTEGVFTGTDIVTCDNAAGEEINCTVSG